jgi:hypothetical protein
MAGWREGSVDPFRQLFLLLSVVTNAVPMECLWKRLTKIGRLKRISVPQLSAGTSGMAAHETKSRNPGNYEITLGVII